MTDTVDLDPVASVLEAVFVGQNRKHALEPFVGELHHPATPLTDEVFVIILAGDGLIPLEPLSELVGAHQPALHQEIERAVHRSGSHSLSGFLELPSNGIDGEVVLG
jgi:hypothetical protein